MNNVGVFLALVFSLSLIYTLVSLIFPKLFFWNKESNRLTNLKQGGIVVGATLILLIIAASFSENGTETKFEKAQNNPQNADNVINGDNNQIAKNLIPGLQPVDVYLNMKNQGFKVDEKFNNELGNSWKCTQSSAGIEYTVDIFSSGNVSTVESITATAMLQDVVNKNIVATKAFLKYVASIPYDGSDPNKVAAWVDDNFNNDKVSIVISKVKFTIYAPTKFVRKLGIEKVQK